MSAAVVALTNWALGLSGETIVIFSGVVLLVVLAVLHFISNLGWRLGVLGGFVILTAFAIHRSYQEAQEIELYVRGVGTGFADIEPNSPILNGARIEVMIQNSNDYDVVARVQRRWFSVYGLTRVAQNADDNADDEVVPFPKRMKAPKPINTEIRFVQAFMPRGPVFGNVDIQVCFSKDGGNTFPLSYRMKGLLEWDMNTDGRLGSYKFTAAEPKEKNEGFYEGCHR